MAKELNLFSTSHCHLCDLAHALVTKKFSNIPLNVIDIAMDGALLVQYGIRIPVLQRADVNKEINWPFNEADIRELLK